MTGLHLKSESDYNDKVFPRSQAPAWECIQ